MNYHVNVSIHDVLPPLRQTYVGYDGRNYALVPQTGPVETFEPSAGEMKKINNNIHGRPGAKFESVLYLVGIYPYFF